MLALSRFLVFIPSWVQSEKTLPTEGGLPETHEYGRVSPLALPDIQPSDRQDLSFCIRYLQEHVPSVGEEYRIFIQHRDYGCKAECDADRTWISPWVLPLEGIMTVIVVRPVEGTDVLQWHVGPHLAVQYDATVVVAE